MHGCLRDQAIRERKADYASNEACAAKEEEVPMETGRLLERILPRLRGE